MTDSHKHSSLLRHGIDYVCKNFYSHGRVTQSDLTLTGACIIKLITAVIYGLSSKLECLSLASLSSLV